MGDNVINNINLESITNPYYGNAYVGFFTKVPQLGDYADDESKSLKSYYLDRMNESIINITMPDISSPMIQAAYFAHQNAEYPGVGDGRLGTMILRFKLDRYMNNYSALATWSFLKYDWTYGGQSETNKLLHGDLEAIFVLQFLDAQENKTREIAYKLLIESLPGLSVGVETPEEINFDVSFEVRDIDISKFLLHKVLDNNQKLV